jgi:hypothetical protein
MVQLCADGASAAPLRQGIQIGRSAAARRVVCRSLCRYLAQGEEFAADLGNAPCASFWMVTSPAWQYSSAGLIFT